jgi:hypothetical protein
MVEDASRRRQKPVPMFPAFTFEGAEEADLLHVRRLGDRIFLATVDGRIRIAVIPSSEFPFDKAANDPRIAFRRLGSVWSTDVRDPRLLRET